MTTDAEIIREFIQHPERSRVRDSLALAALYRMEKANARLLEVSEKVANEDLAPIRGDRPALIEELNAAIYFARYGKEISES